MLLGAASAAFGQTSTVTVNTSTKVTQPAVGTFTLDGATNFGIYRGTGTPASVVTAPPGSLYLDLNGAFWLKTSGTGNTGWTQMPTTSGGTPGGSDTYVQFNDASAFGGDADFTWDKTNNILKIATAGMFAWPTGTVDTALARNAAGVVEVNNGTAGQYRDLRARTILAGDGALATPSYAFGSSSSTGMWYDPSGGSYGAHTVLSVASTYGHSVYPWGFLLRSDSGFYWSSGVVPNTGGDTGLARNAAGVVEVNSSTAGAFRQLKLAGITIAPTASQVGNVISSQTVVTSTVDQTATAETAHVTYTVPANVCAVGTTFRITAWGNMDNGTTAITYTPRLRWGGTGGVQLLATPTVVGTTTALTGKTWKAEAVVTIVTTGATGTAIAEMALSNHTASTTGLYAQDEANSTATAVTIDTTANKDLVLSWTLSATTGTPHVRTIGGLIEMVRN